MKAKKALTLSIVIPVYNEQHHIKQCLEAIKQQTVKPFEVIVVDNNCTDETIAIAKKFSFVKVVKAKQQGIVFARNAGFNASRGDIIGRIDADTHIANDWVASVEAYMATNDNISAVSGPTHIREWQGRMLWYWLHRITYYWATWVFLGHRTLFGSNMAVRRKSWQSVSSQTCLKTSIHEDMDLSIHLKKSGFKIGFTDRLQATISPRRILRMWHYPLMWVRTKTDHFLLSR